MANVLSHLRNLFAGFMVGTSSQLVGVSGGTMAIIFGVYERLIHDISRLTWSIRNDFLFLLVMGVGILLGMWLPSYGIEYLIDNYHLFAYFIFTGLIIGQLPSVYSEAISEKKVLGWKDLLFVLIGVGIIAGLALIEMYGVGEYDSTAHDIGNLMLMFGCGIILAIAKVAPGLSGSTLLVVLGLYELYISAFTNMDLYFLIPMGLGLIVGAIGFAKVMEKLIEKHRTPTYLVVLGLTIGSAITIYPGVGSVEDLMVGLCGLAIGILISLGLIFFAMKTGNTEKLNE